MHESMSIRPSQFLTGSSGLVFLGGFGSFFFIGCFILTGIVDLNSLQSLSGFFACFSALGIALSGVGLVICAWGMWLERLIAVIGLDALVACTPSSCGVAINRSYVDDRPPIFLS